jgi:hypothetical protein
MTEELKVLKNLKDLAREEFILAGTPTPAAEPRAK